MDHYSQFKELELEQLEDLARQAWMEDVFDACIEIYEFCQSEGIKSEFIAYYALRSYDAKDDMSGVMFIREAYSEEVTPLLDGAMFLCLFGCQSKLKANMDLQGIIRVAKKALGVICANLSIMQGKASADQKSEIMDAFDIAEPDFDELEMTQDLGDLIAEIYYQIAFLHLTKDYDAFDEETALYFVSIAIGFAPWNPSYYRLGADICVNLILSKKAINNEEMIEEMALDYLEILQNEFDEELESTKLLVCARIIAHRSQDMEKMQEYIRRAKEGELQEVDFLLLSEIYKVAAEVSGDVVYYEEGYELFEEQGEEVLNENLMYILKSSFAEKTGRYETVVECQLGLKNFYEANGTPEEFRGYDILIRAYRELGDLESAKEWESMKQETVGNNAMGIPFFMAALMDFGMDKEALIYASRHMDLMSFFGMNQIEDVTKEKIYDLVGRQADGSIKPNLTYLLRKKDPRIETAIDNIYRKQDNSKVMESFAMLSQASSEGNGDACYFLGRMYLGECFIPRGLNFPENGEVGEQFFNMSLNFGSAIGMFACRRLGGFEPEGGSFLRDPFRSELELWQSIYFNAIDGDMFYKYVLANSFYYGDVLEQLNLAPTGEVLYLCARIAQHLYEEQLANGYAMGLGNYQDIITSGDYGVEPDEERYLHFRDLVNQVD